MNRNYKLLKLNNEVFDYLIIAKDNRSPLKYIDAITQSLGVDRAKLLMDLTLINGFKFNRYVACDYKKGEFYLKSCRVVHSISKSIEDLSKTYFRDNEHLVEQSTIDNRAKHQLLKH